MLPAIEARELKPLGIGEIVDVAVNIFIRNIGTLLKVAAIVFVPLTIVIFLLDLVALQEASITDPGAAIFEFGDDRLRVVNETTFNLAIGIQSILTLLATTLAIAGTLRAVGNAYVGRDVDAGDSLRFGLGRIHSIIWISILFGIGVGIGLILLVLPGIWLLIAWSLALPVLIFEGIKGSKALGRSFNLVRKHWWHTFGALLLGYILIIVVQLILPVIVELIAGSIENVYLYVALLDIANALTSLFVIPLFASLVTVIYYDLRVRKEGYDVQLLTQELSGEPAHQPPPPTGSEPQPSGPPPPPPPTGSQPPSA